MTEAEELRWVILILGGKEARHRIEMSSKSTVTKKSRDLVNNHAEGRLDDVGSAKSVVA
jgi:hypothetical protein